MLERGKSYKMLHQCQSFDYSEIQDATPKTGIARINKADKGNPFHVRKISDESTGIYAWNAYSAKNNFKGLYSIGTDNVNLEWSDSFFDTYNYTLSTGYLNDNKICGVASASYMGYIMAYTYVEYDLMSGELLNAFDLDLDATPFFTHMAYNPNDGCIYGSGQYFSYNNGETALFMKVPADDMSNVTILSELPGTKDLTALCFNENEEMFYGVDNDNNFVQLATDGTYTTLFQLHSDQAELYYPWIMGLVYNPDENLYYCNPACVPIVYIATIDPVAKNVDIKYELPDGNQFTAMFTTLKTEQNPLQPQKPELIETSFIDGSTSGYNIYHMPELLTDGTSIDSPLTATALVDGETYGTYESAPGDELKVTFSELSRGNHTFGLYVTAGGYDSKIMRSDMFVGSDTPSAPQNVRIDQNILSWDAVRSSVNGGYVNYSDLTYNIYLNEDKIATTSETSYTLTIPEDATLKVYTATVTASYDGYESAPGYSNSIITGNPFNLPLSITPTPEEVMLCTILDANQDGATWSYNEYSNAFQFGYSEPGFDNNDWLFLPPFNFDRIGNYLEISFDAAIRGTSYANEYLTVYIGTSPEPSAMKQCIIDTFTPMNGQSTEYQNIDSLFIPSERGPLYIGFHSTSDSYQMGMLVRNIKISDPNISDKSPDKVENLSSEGATDGILSATVTFDMPVKNISDETLDPDASLVATVSSPVESKTITGTPGSSKSLTIATVQGVNEITISVELDGNNSPSASTEVYTGVYVPATPLISETEVAADMMSMTIRWEPVSQAAEPGKYVGDNVTYTIYQGIDSNMGLMWYPIQSNVEECQFSYSVEESDHMSIRYIGVSAENEAGNNGSLSYTMELLGAPYSLPLTEDFTDGQLSTSPWLPYSPTDKYLNYWQWFDISQWVNTDIYPEGTFAFGAINQAGKKAGISIPRFNTQNIEAASVTLNAYVDIDAPEITLNAIYSGMTGDPIELAAIQPAEGRGFEEISIPLPDELLGKDWVQVNITGSFYDSSQILLLVNASVTGQKQTNISYVDSIRKINGGKGFVELTGYDNACVTISDLTGTIIFKGTAQSPNTTIDLEKGLYLINADNDKAKVIVR